MREVITCLTKLLNWSIHFLTPFLGRLLEICYTTYKAENAGRRVILVNPFNTSQMCSKCGTSVEKDISERTHNYPFCALSINRDLNVSINVLRLRIQSVRKNDRCPSLQ